MPLNLGASKQAQKIIFPRNCANDHHPPIYFDNILVTENTVQKHIGLYLDENLNCSTYINEKLRNEGIRLLRKLCNTLPRQAFVTIYEAFIRPHLGYGDIAYDKLQNEVFSNKTEKAQYDTTSPITAAIRGTSREELYTELGLEFLTLRRWFRKSACFQNNQSTGLLNYLLQLIPTNS